MHDALHVAKNHKMETMRRPDSFCAVWDIVAMHLATKIPDAILFSPSGPQIPPVNSVNMGIRRRNAVENA